MRGSRFGRLQNLTGRTIMPALGQKRTFEIDLVSVPQNGHFSRFACRASRRARSHK